MYGTAFWGLARDGLGMGKEGNGRSRELGMGLYPFYAETFLIDTPYLRRLCVESDEKEEGQNLSASFNVAMKWE